PGGRGSARDRADREPAARGPLAARGGRGARDADRTPRLQPSGARGAAGEEPPLRVQHTRPDASARTREGRPPAGGAGRVSRASSGGRRRGGSGVRTHALATPAAGSPLGTPISSREDRDDYGADGGDGGARGRPPPQPGPQPSRWRGSSTRAD